MTDSPYALASWRALGTSVDLVVVGPERLGEARALTVDLLDQVDRACSRFRDDSDLCRANAAAGTWVRTSRLLVDAVEVAVEAARRTDGLVDPTLGLSLAAVGYDRDLAVVQARGAAPRAGTSPTDLPPVPARRGAWQELRTDPDGAVRVPPGSALDLGATGKAFASDLIAAALVERLDLPAVISVGGDVAVAAPPSAPEYPWQVAVKESPEDDDAELLTLPSGALATSTTTHRRWEHGGREVHHLLDPATGRPAQRRWRTATVLARTCVEANTASTATIVRGESAPAWLAEHGLVARLVAQDGEIVRVGAWPTPGERHTGSTGD